MKFENKGMFGPFTILTCVITGALFPLLGALIAVNIGAVQTLYVEGVVLCMLGGFIAHWLLSHAVHDLIHMKIEERQTVSRRSLKIILVVSAVVLFIIALYLTWQRGWPVMVFAIIGFIVSMYAEGLIHHESQMAFGAMFLVLGSFYVQTASLELPIVSWLKILMIALFSFFSQYGWLLFYRLDDYNWSIKVKNRSILITKTGLIFLIIYFFI
ncbi:MAG: hypothetical protein QXX20_01980 [Candidatus Thermoplasmatota archaeon]